jgi:hypothetical protein
MDTTQAAVLTGVVVTVGQWAKEGKGPSIKIVVGATVLAFMLAGISAGNDELGSRFAALVLVGALMVYVPSIVKKLGYSK